MGIWSRSPLWACSLTLLVSACGGTDGTKVGTGCGEQLAQLTCPAGTVQSGRGEASSECSGKGNVDLLTESGGLSGVCRGQGTCEIKCAVDPKLVCPCGPTSISLAEVACIAPDKCPRVCGDAIVQPPEECDLGRERNGMGSGCDTSCRSTSGGSACDSNGTPVANGATECVGTTGSTHVRRCVDGIWRDDPACLMGETCRQGACAPACAGQPDGTSCGMNLVCSAGSCVACAVGASCTSTNSCHTAALTCSAGPVCTDSGNKAPGTSCGMNQVCGSGASGGMCVPCTVGAICTSTNSCHTAALTCSAGPVCTDSGNQPDGTACPGGNCFSGSCRTSDYWLSISPVGEPTPRQGHVAEWTGTEMLIWGGQSATGVALPDPNGARYDPRTDTWRPIASVGAPSDRYGAYHAWTGSELIVWGGQTSTGGAKLNDGAIYNPSTNLWRAMNPGTLAGRVDSTGGTAVFIAGQVIVWSGDLAVDVADDGGRYTPAPAPALGSWAPVATTGQPPGRDNTRAVRTDNALMFVWGGRRSQLALATGGLYNPNTGPNTDAWISMSASPITFPGRQLHTMVPASGDVLIWGGVGSGPSATALNDGARFNPQRDTWTLMSTIAAPAARYCHSAVWTDSQMIIWGGIGTGMSPAPRQDGGRYIASSDAWATLNSANAPSARLCHSAIWAREVGQMIVWGGQAGAGMSAASGGRYRP